MLGGAYGRTRGRARRAGQQRRRRARRRRAAARARRRRSRLRRRATCRPALPACDLVIDAAFGTGFRGTWTAPDIGRRAGARRRRPDRARRRHRRRPAAGAARRSHRDVRGRQARTLRSATVPTWSASCTVADIGLAGRWPRMGVVEAVDVAAWLPRRERRAHKWRHAVRLVAGSPGMTGAAALAAGAAQRTGSGMVVASSPGVDDVGRSPRASRPKSSPARWRTSTGAATCCPTSTASVRS